jgi:uncharacterized protein YndB with AHSA1/START domain
MRIIEQSVEINAAPDKVWRVFSDPVVTRKIGGEYVTDWKEGSPFGWMGRDGKMYTSGNILRCEPGILLQHNLFDLEDRNKLQSVIEYRFEERNGSTIIFAREELHYNLSDDQFREAVQGWQLALNSVKEAAESL